MTGRTRAEVTRALAAQKTDPPIFAALRREFADRPADTTTVPQHRDPEKGTS